MLCLKKDNSSSCESEVSVSREIDECFGTGAVESNGSEL
jgi:hypothetical protein